MTILKPQGNRRRKERYLLVGCSSITLQVVIMENVKWWGRGWWGGEEDEKEMKMGMKKENKNNKKGCLAEHETSRKTQKW